MLKNRTKQLFADAICDLAQNSPIDKITIADIANYSGASRQTFYYHFKDKYELIIWVYENNANQILRIDDNHMSFKDSIVMVFQHLLIHKHFYRKAINMNEQNSFKDALFNHTRAYYKERIIQQFGEETITDELMFSIEFNSYGAVNMCKKWINADVCLPPDVIADRILNNMPETLKNYLF